VARDPNAVGRVIQRHPGTFGHGLKPGSPRAAPGRRHTVLVRHEVMFKDWPKVFPDALNAQVIAERLTEHAEVFVLEKSYRTARI